MDVSDSQPRDVVAAQPHFGGGSPRANLTGGKGSTEDQAEDDEDAADEEFAFRLFSTAKPTQKVVLEEDVEPQGEGGLVGPRRLSYYVVTDLSARQRNEYDFAAVSGDEVLARSKTRSWGFELPWKVTTITVKRKASPEDAKAKDGAKRRPGKKQRISLRKRAKVKEEKAQQVAKKLVEKEEHIKDKKKRMNRLKKLRRRAKDKEKKQAGQGGEGVGSGDDSDGST